MNKTLHSHPEGRIKKLTFFCKNVTLLIALCLVSFFSSAQGLPELMYYRFDCASTANDALSATRVGAANGTLTSGTIGSTGQFGTALQGVGTTANIFSTGWTTMSLSGSWTISFWVAGISTTNTSTTINYLFGSGSNIVGSSFRAFTGGGSIAGVGNLLIRATGLSDILISGCFNAAGSPVVITISYDASASQSKTYVNGVLAVTTTQTPATFTGTDFIIGNYAGVVGATVGIPSGAKIDEFRLYNRALSQSEITATWNQKLQSNIACTGTPTKPSIATTVSPTPCNTSIILTANDCNLGNNLIYQWEQSTSGIGSWINAVGGSGQTTLTYTTPVLTSNIYYRFKVTCPTTALSATSDSFAVMITIPPIGKIVGDSIFCPGQTRVFTAPVVANATSYVWSLPSGWVGSSSTNSITTIAGSSAGNISAFAVTPCGNTNTDTFNVKFDITPTQPSAIVGNAVVCSAATQQYSVPPVVGARSYIWSLPSGWTGTSTSNVISVTPGATGGTISVIASSMCGNSAARTLNVSVTSTATTAPIVTGSSSVCSTSTNMYSVAPVPAATSYTWTLPTGWTGTSTTNTINAVATSAGGNITVKANTGCASVTNPTTTFPVTITPNATPTVKVSASDTTICTNEMVTFTPIATNQGTLPVYTWYVNGSSVATGLTYVTSSLTTSSSITVKLNSSYACPTTNNFFSAPFIINVQNRVAGGININATSNNPVCAGTLVGFTANTNGAGLTPSYQWQRNGSNVGRDTPYYAASNFSNGDNIVCTMTTSEACPQSTNYSSNRLTLTVTPQVTANVTASASPGTSINYGQTVMFTANPTNGGTSPNYQWFKNGVAIANATNNTYTTNTLINGDRIQVRLASSNICAAPSTVLSNAMQMVVVNTGVTNLEIGDFTLSPNPNNGNFIIGGTLPANLQGKTMRIEVQNMLGQIVHTESQNITSGKWSAAVQTNSISEGLYLLRISTDGKMHQVKFNVMK